jgi:TrmH family RNA methyltransferase
MGSISRVRVEYTDILSWLTENNDVRIYAAVLHGSDVTKMEKIKEGIIVIGNESKGVHQEMLKLANVQITIPGKGKAESLNAAVATGIILSHLV